MQKMDETVFITGAGRGVGFAIAEKLATQGYDLILNYRKPQGKGIANLMRFTESDLGKQTKITLAKADISETREVEKMVEELKTNQGIDRIDHLVLNAAAAPFKNFTDMTRSDWKLLLNTNLVGNVACVTEIVPLMTRGGTITFISSVGSRMVLKQYPLGVIKAALEQLVAYLDVELHLKNIRVNGVCAGFINTDMYPYLTDLWPDLPKKIELMGRQRSVLEPEEVANIVSFLISKDSSAICGTTILADLGVNR